MNDTAHDLIPFPKWGTFAEVRMVYCRRCGATQPVEAAERNPLPPCELVDPEISVTAGGPTHHVRIPRPDTPAT